MDKPIPRKTDGTFAPGHPGKQPGTISKAKRKLRELVEAEAEGDPLPVRMVRIGRRAEEQGEYALALTAYAAAAQYTYSKPKSPATQSQQGDELSKGASYKVVAFDEDPSPDYPGQRILVDPNRSVEEGIVKEIGHVGNEGQLKTFTIRRSIVP